MTTTLEQPPAPADAKSLDAPATWQERRKRRLIVTSATQHETFELCARKWWLNKVRGLPEPTTQSQAFGTVLHSVVERFLTADDLGRDKHGNPVELYPPGWHIAYDRFEGKVEGEASPEEQDIIQRLVAKAIEEGVLERRPGRQVELDFRRTIIELGCPSCGGEGVIDTGMEPSTVAQRPEDVIECPECKGDKKGTHVQIVGFVDVAYPDKVEDHKTTKSMKYAKSPDALKSNRQVLIYAKMALLDAEERGLPVPNEVTLRHNVYCKDPNDLRVRKTEVTVSREEIESAWEDVVVNAMGMDRLRRTCNTWSDCPDPPNPHKACNAYGGCCYRSICSGMESEAAYENRLDSHSKRAKDTQLTQITVSAANVAADTAPNSKGSNVSTFAAKLAAMKAAGTGAGAIPAAPPPAINNPAPAYQPPAPQTLPSAPPPATPATTSAPPWADPNCPACKGKGFNTRGNPCQICDVTAAKAGRPKSSEFIIAAVGDGTFVWEPRDGSTPAGASPTATAGQPVTADVRIAPVVPQAPPPVTAPAAPAPTPAAIPVAAVAEVAGSSVEEGEDDGTGKKKAGRPPKGFQLLINVPVIKGEGRKGSGRAVIHLSDVLDSLGKDIAKAAGKSSFFEVNAFQRRDTIAAMAPAMAEQFGAEYVVALGVSPGNGDMLALVNALIPLAGTVIGNPLAA